MTALRRVEIVWSGSPGSPYVSTFNLLHTAGQADNVANALEDWLTAMKPDFISGVTAKVQPEQTIFDDSTGAPTGVEVGPGPTAIGGSNTGEALPWATQGLIRLTTSTYLGSRRLAGRLFLPAMSANNSQGKPTPAFTGRVALATGALMVDLGASNKWRVYSRTGHTSADVEAFTLWDNWAVLRSRRD